MRCVYSNVVRDTDGDIVADATITVYLAGGTTPATIYSGFSDTSPVATSTVTSNTAGEFTFYISRFDYDSEQTYKFTITKTGMTTQTYDNVLIDRVVIGTYTISADTTVTTNVDVPKGVIYSVASGKTLTFSGTLRAGRYKIFTGSGAVVLKEAYPEWWYTSGAYTTALQSALDSLANGGTVDLDAATYSSVKSLTITNAGVTLQGRGWNTIIDCDCDDLLEDSDPQIWIQANNCTVKHLKMAWSPLPTVNPGGDDIDYNNDISVGWSQITGGQTLIENTLIENVYVYGSKHHGIGVGRTSLTTVKECKIESTKGIGVFGYYARGLKIHGNYTYDTKNDGIYVAADGADEYGPDSYAENISIDSNIINHTYNRGIATGGGYGVTITNNIIDDTWAQAICAVKGVSIGTVAPADVVVSNNIIRRAFQNYGAGETYTADKYSVSAGTYGCIEVQASNTATISNNTINDDSALVYYLPIYATANYVVINGNNISTNWREAITIGYEITGEVGPDDILVSGLAMTGNVLRRGTGKGYQALSFHRVTNGVITGNYFDCGGTGLSAPWGQFTVCDTSANLIIGNNVVTHSITDITTTGGPSSPDSGGINMTDNQGLTDSTNNTGLSAPTTTLTNPDSDLNTTYKYTGKQVWDTTESRYVYATGPDAADAWVDALGAGISVPSTIINPPLEEGGEGGGTGEGSGTAPTAALADNFSGYSDGALKTEGSANWDGDIWVYPGPIYYNPNVSSHTVIGSTAGYIQGGVWKTITPTDSECMIQFSTIAPAIGSFSLFCRYDSTAWTGYECKWYMYGTNQARLYVYKWFSGQARALLGGPYNCGYVANNYKFGMQVIDNTIYGWIYDGSTWNQYAEVTDASSNPYTGSGKTGFLIQDPYVQTMVVSNWYAQSLD